MTTQVEKHLKVSEVAAPLALKESTIRKWLLLRKLPYRKINGAVRIPESSLALVLEAGYVPAHPEAR